MVVKFLLELEIDEIALRAAQSEDEHDEYDIDSPPHGSVSQQSIGW